MTGALRYSLIAGAYIGVFVGLDRLTYLQPFGAVGITPFDPWAGLTLALLLLQGLRFAPVVPVAALVADLVTPYTPEVPDAPWYATVLAALLMSAGYAWAALLLRRRPRFDLGLSRFVDLLQLLGVCLLATLLVAALDVGVYIALGPIPPGDFWAALGPSWVGDAIGTLALTPALLVYAGPGAGLRRQEWPFGSPARMLEAALQVGAILLSVAVVFSFTGSDTFKFFYLLFVPIIWVAVRQGLRGATLGLLLSELAVIVAVRHHGHDTDTMLVFQMLMLVLGLTGLFLGAIVGERQQTSRALSDNRAYLEAILGTAPDGILIIEGEGEGLGRIVQANPAAERLFGRGEHGPGPGWLCGMAVTDLLPAFARCQASGSGEIEGQRPGGPPFPAEVAVSAALLGGRRRLVAVVRDVTRRARAEAWLRQHQMDVAHADRVTLVGEMGSAIAHEVSQPLTAIAAYTRGCRLILDAPGADLRKIGDSLEKILGQANRAGEVLRRLREFLHREDPRPAPIAVADLVAEVVDLTQVDLAHREVHLAIELPEGLPPVLVDRIHIEQVLLNLVRNGVDAICDADCPFRVVTVAARLEDQRVVFEVADSGPGVDPVIADKLFQPFQSTKGKGMGLGLSISRTLVEAYGGQLRCVSHQGLTEGARFRFDLPLAPAAAPTTTATTTTSGEP